MKAYTLKQGKLIPALNGTAYKTPTEIFNVIRWQFESRMINENTQFLIIQDDRIITVINKYDF